jgi:hypothetical protein
LQTGLWNGLYRDEIAVFGMLVANINVVLLELWSQVVVGTDLPVQDHGLQESRRSGSGRSPFDRVERSTRIPVQSYWPFSY